jgi:hypothetical protein
MLHLQTQNFQRQFWLKHQIWQKKRMETSATPSNPIFKKYGQDSTIKPIIIL